MEDKALKQLNIQVTAITWRIEGFTKLYEAAVLLGDTKEAESIRTTIILLNENFVDTRAQVIEHIKRI